MKLISEMRILIMAILLSPVAVLSQDQACAVLKIYRPAQISSSLVMFKVFVNDTEVASLTNNSSVTVSLKEEGNYQVSVIPESRGDSYRKRTKKLIDVHCGEEIFIAVNGGSLFAESVVMKKDALFGAKGYAKTPTDKSTTFNYTGNVNPVVSMASATTTQTQNNPIIKKRRKSKFSATCK